MSSASQHRSRAARARVLAVAVVGALIGPVIAAGPAGADTVREGQWFLRALQIEQAHRISTGAGVTVAVVDTGIEADHPDLAGQVVGGVAIGRGDSAGGPLVDDDSHGTSIAGVIAAKGGGPNNALGIAPKAKLLSVRTNATSEGSYANDVAAGIRWAVDNGAKVINLSLAGAAAATPAETEAVGYALSKDVVVVAGAGNRDQGLDEVGSPANLPGVVAVGSTGRDGSVYRNSAAGPELGVVAPGEQIVTTGSRRAGKTSGYVVPTGTSEATAVVSGVVALIRSKYPALRAADVVNRLVRTADDLGPPGRDPDSGFGRVNPVRALTEAVPETGVNPLGQQAVTPSGPAGAAPGDPGIRPRSWWRTRILLLLAALVFVLLLLVAVPVLAVARSRRRRRAAAPFGQVRR